MHCKCIIFFIGSKNVGKFLKTKGIEMDEFARILLVFFLEGDTEVLAHWFVSVCGLGLFCSGLALSIWQMPMVGDAG